MRWRPHIIGRMNWLLYFKAGASIPPTGHGASPQDGRMGSPQFLIIMNLILGPAIVSSLLLYLLLYFSCV